MLALNISEVPQYYDLHDIVIVYIVGYYGVHINLYIIVLHTFYLKYISCIVVYK